MKPGDIIVIAVVFLLLAAATVWYFYRRKKGKNSCGNSCAGCPFASEGCNKKSENGQAGKD